MSDCNKLNHHYVDDPSHPCGGYWAPNKGTADGAALVSDRAIAFALGLTTSSGASKTAPTSAQPRFANNVSAPAGATSASNSAIATVQIGDVVQRSWSTDDVDGVVISAWGGTGFAGVYAALSATDIGTTAAALRLTGVNDNGARQRYWVPKGDRVLIPFAGLKYVYLVAMDVDGSEDNHVDLVPV